MVMEGSEDDGRAARAAGGDEENESRGIQRASLVEAVKGSAPSMVENSCPAGVSQARDIARGGGQGGAYLIDNSSLDA